MNFECKDHSIGVEGIFGNRWWRGEGQTATVAGKDDVVRRFRVAVASSGGGERLRGGGRGFRGTIAEIR